MPVVLDLTNRKYGRLTALKDVGRNGRGRRVWRCLCICGKTKEVCTDYLQSGRTKSCGCLGEENRKTIGSRVPKKHGMHKTTEYRAWLSMRGRCNNSKGRDYGGWGGRGIKVCKKWDTSFEQFYKDMGKKPSKKHSLDRENVNGDYKPSNCRWATAIQQSQNRRKQLSPESKRIVNLIMEKDNITHAVAYKRLRRLAKCLINN